MRLFRVFFEIGSYSGDCYIVKADTLEAAIDILRKEKIYGDNEYFDKILKLDWCEDLGDIETFKYLSYSQGD